MKRDLAALSDSAFDVVIIGGGVYGMITAWDASLRGMKVALVEKGDFAHATTAGCYKLIHGGLRYLQHLDFVRMRVSIGERLHMMRMAPHQVHPLEFIFPCYGHGTKSREAMWAALLVNDIVAFDRNKLRDPEKRIPAGRIAPKSEVLERLPGIKAQGLTAGAVFYDAQMYSAERLALSFGLSAVAEGAVLANYAEVTGFVREGSKIKAVKVKDTFTGTAFEVQGRCFVNMTGPWSEITRQLVATDKPDRTVVRSKGVQIFTRPLSTNVAFPIQTKQRDVSAVISQGGRHLFVTPWRGRSFIGQTDMLYKGDPAEFRITEEDVAGFLKDVNEAHPAAELKREDVQFWVGGMIPVGEATTNPEVAKISHKYEILDHARKDGIDNLVSAIGVKFTICRHIAKDVVDILARKLGVTRPCRTPQSRVVGGDIDDFKVFLGGVVRKSGLPEAAARHLVHSYGSNAKKVLAYGKDDAELLKTVGESPEVIAAQVVHAVREEMAFTLSDVVMRRTDLGTVGHPGRAALEDCARIMAKELGWSADRTTQELATTEAIFKLG